MARSSRPVDANRGASPAVPRWVKVFGIVSVVFLALFALLHGLGGGHHGHFGL